MNESARTWFILRIAVVAAGLVILFFSGILPVENYLAFVSPTQLTAAVVPADVASLTNENRIENGLPELKVNPLLAQAAQLKAEDMAQNSYYAHISPDGKSPLYWLQRVGYKYLNAGENLVIDRTTSEEAVTAWMNSPDHRENILRPQFTEVGVGVAPGEYEGIPTIFVVEEFGTPYPLSEPAVRAAAQTVAVVNVQAPPKPSIVTEVKAFMAPLAHTITVVPKPAPKTTSIVHVVPVKTVIPAKQISEASTSSPSVTSASTTSSTSATTNAALISFPALTSLSFALSPAFFTPVHLAHVPQSEGRGSTTSVPETHDQTPTWILQMRAYILRFTNFVPRIW
jgi:hypothetical protein